MASDKIEFRQTQIKRDNVAQFIRLMAFPGGPVIENPPYNAGNRGLIPGRRTEVPPTAGQLKQQVTTRELVRHNFAAETRTRHSQISACYF